SVTIDVLDNDTDVDLNDEATNFSLVSAVISSVDNDSGDIRGRVQIINDKVVFATDGDFEHLNETESAEVLITYVMADASGATSTSTALVTVTGVNDTAEITGVSTADLVETDAVLT
ncbi:hypothetical protein, partial [Vibrio sp. 10N.286.49.B3]|uniref:hypothetical protein n=1 Tax=Vibrio sp. 10N.286.49.B3 TaxID=1880855 RepID=UPI0012FFEEA3